MNHAVHNKNVSFKGITSPAYSIYRLKVQAFKRFFHHLLCTEIYQAEYKATLINSAVTGKIKVPITAVARAMA